MARKKLQEISDNVRDLYLDGYTKSKISDALGITVNQVAYILYSLLKLHVKAPRKVGNTNLVELMPKNVVDRVISLASWGYNNKEIAEDTHLPYNRVNVLVKEATNKNLIKKLA